MSDLFAPLAREKAPGPLADRLRPAAFDEVVGQEHLTGEDGVLTRMAESGQWQSIILWGPPGCGKTTLARLIAESSLAAMETVSAVSSGVADLKKIFEKAALRRSNGTRSLLFVDEIHRFNRAQQDVLLPVVEDGTILLVGATTENPSFELNAALLSRARVLVLKRLDDAALEKLLKRAETTLDRVLPLTDDGREAIKAMADGDGRYLLNLVEALQTVRADAALGAGELAELLQRRAPVYDKAQESHYNLISALHKSVRGSDPQAALYWLARMLEGGEDPLYLARRLVRMAYEDIGLADPGAAVHALAAKDAYDFLGSPEGELALAQVVVYLASAPKSNAAYSAYKAARKDAKQTGSLMPPMHILNAPTRMMKELGYSDGYAYDHDAPDAFSGQDYFPDGLERRDYYRPTQYGSEAKIAERLARWDGLRKKRG